jgi:hypothetical protein
MNDLLPVLGRRARAAAALLLAAGLCACGGGGAAGGDAARLRSEIEQLRADLEALRAATARPPTLTLLDAEAKLSENMQSLDRKMDRLSGEHQAAFARLSARISDLEKRLGAARAPAETAPAAPAAAADSSISFFTAPPNPAALFPAAVTGVKGEEVATGTRTASRYVDTQETYRDQFGELKPKQELRDFEVTEHAYRVTCSVENLTDKPLELVLRSGPGSLNLALAPRETRAAVSLPSAKGANLVVEAGARTKSYPVPF